MYICKYEKKMMTPDILPISYITEVSFYDFKFQICYTTSNNNNSDFICYRILSPSGYSHSFALDINNPFINNYLRENYSNLNQNNYFIYDNYLKSLIDRSINEYYIPINSIPYTRSNYSHMFNININNNINDNIINNNEILSNNNESNQDETETFDENLEIDNNVLNENMDVNNSLFEEFRLNADSFLEDLYFHYLIPLNFQRHLKDIVYRTIWVVYETIVNIPDSYWDNNIERLTTIDFNKVLSHENMNNKLLENLNSTDNTCSICLEKIELNQKTTILKCNHIYHYDCAKTWFTSKCHQLTCPYCRCDIRHSEMNNIVYHTPERYFT